MITLEEILSRLENLAVDLNDHIDLNKPDRNDYWELEHIINLIYEFKDEVDNGIVGPMLGGIYLLPGTKDILKKLEKKS